MEQYQELCTDSSNRIPRLSFSSFCNPANKFEEYTLSRVRCLENLEKVYQVMEQRHLHNPVEAFRP